MLVAWVFWRTLAIWVRTVDTATPNRRAISPGSAPSHRAGEHHAFGVGEVVDTGEVLDAQRFAHLVPAEHHQDGAVRSG